MQQHESASSSYALPYIARAQFWKFGVWPLLLIVVLVVGPVVVPPLAERRWQAYAVVGLVAVPLLYMLGWVASRRIELSHEDIRTRARFNRTLAIRYSDIRSVDEGHEGR
jgi:hypothetical protein